MSKNSLKNSLGSSFGTSKKIEKQNIDIPIIKETVSEIHKTKNNNELETKGVFIKIEKGLHKNIKKYCVLNEVDMQEFFTEAIVNKAKIDRII